MGPTTRARFVHNRRGRRRRGGGQYEASDDDEQQATSSSSSEEEGDEEEEEAEASMEEVDDGEDEVEGEAVADEPAAKESLPAPGTGEKRAGRKGPITISLKKVCKVCKKTGHEAGFKGAVYIDCPMKPCFLCKMPGLLGVWDYVKLHEKITYDSVHSCVLNSMKVDTVNDGILYTASSDGTISSTDLDTGIGSPLLNLNPNGWNNSIYAASFDTVVLDVNDLILYWAAQFHSWLDRRSKTRIGNPVLIHKKGSKVTSLHCNPVQPEVLLSSGNDHYDYTETIVVIGRYISENYNGVALHPIDFIDTSSGKLLAEVMDPDITTISPVNKLHPRDDILATGSSR
ncbi:hypothetical protein PR202_gb26494 [Eleusine coracana subsp. coracana]|uniref:Uncharacterized protein n=1 Tax=Eleusine coracana subsp. coracana TaxID=191504 RepID=A0AAV5FSQ8_ELECO|nr:hypothetical protein PR202_gb26494 [Eleusine coracana subsp. coracana]